MISDNLKNFQRFAFSFRIFFVPDLFNMHTAVKATRQNGDLKPEQP